MKKQIIQHKIIPAGLMTLLVAGLVVYSTQQHHARQQLVLSAEMDGTYEAHINIVLNQKYGGSCYTPQCTASYGELCPFLTASGTLNGDAAEYARRYFDNPMCAYRENKNYFKVNKKGEQKFDYYKCGAQFKHRDFDWWKDTVWSGIAPQSIDKNNPSSEHFCQQICALLCGHNGLLFIDADNNNPNNTHLWALCNVTFTTWNNGKTFYIMCETINTRHDSMNFRGTKPLTYEDFQSLFIDIESCYLY